MSRILVIAPDSDLRRSLEFALRAEGHEVTWQASIGTREMPSGFDCTVLDHHAVGSDISNGAVFCESFRPVILLANFVPHPLSRWAVSTVQKPLLGQALLNAIRDAAATRETTK